jgi:hypothetical protein
MAKGPRGPAPQPNSQRRRRNKPVSHGAANPVEGKAAAKRPELGIESPTQLIQDLWDSLQGSVEAKFYSASDWHRVRAELTHGNGLLRSIANGDPVSAQSWKAFQDALTELLVSPAAKRRAGIELKPPTDPDEDEAEATVTELRAKIRAVP